MAAARVRLLLLHPYRMTSSAYLNAICCMALTFVSIAIDGERRTSRSMACSPLLRVIMVSLMLAHRASYC